MLLNNFDNLLNYCFMNIPDHDERHTKASIEDQGDLPGTSGIDVVPETPRKLKMRHKIRNLQTKVCRLKKKGPNVTSERHVVNEVCKQLRRFLPKSAANFVISQIKANQKKSSKGIRWTMSDKTFALSIFYHSRKAYRLLRKIFVMPCKTTLMNLLKKCNVFPGFHSKVMDALANRARNLNENDKQVVLVFDEMAVKTGLSYDKSEDCIAGVEDFGELGKTKLLADQALVFMVRGLASKWKQCIGYFYSSGPIKAETLQCLTLKAIEKLATAGFKVRALVCDQGTNNRRFIETLAGVTADKPYLLHADQKVHIFYDPPHLLKSIRNNLQKTGFKHNENLISWDHIVKFYKFDQEGPIRMAPKLTYDHIYLPMFTKMRVNLAAQVLSHSVAAGISTLQRLGHLPEEAKATAEFVEFMDRLFNTFNSSNLNSHQCMGHAISENSGHMEFLNESLIFLNSLIPLAKRQVPCLTGWKISINSLKSLWHELSNENFSFLLTNRLNQDCAENLFSIIRGKGGGKGQPRCQGIYGSISASCL